MMGWASDLGSLMGQQLVYAAVVAAVVALIIKVARIKSPMLRQGLWSLVLLRLVLPTDMSSPISLRGPGEDVVQAAQTTLTKVVSEIEASAPMTKTTEAVTPLDAETAPFGGRFDRVQLRPDPVIASHSVNERAVEAAPLDRDGTFPWVALALAFWAVGVGVFAGQYIRGWIGYMRAVHRGRRVEDVVVQNMLGYWRTVMGVGRPVQLVAGANHISPFTMGLFRPVIFVPEALVDRARKAALDAALGHEMAHIRRLDDLWIKFEAIIKIAYFFFPVVWWAGARIEAAREEACDALALHRGQRQAKAYAAGLLTALKLCAEPHRVAPCPGLTQAMGGLRQRLLNLKAKKESPMATLRSLAIIALVGGCTLPLAQAADEPQDSADVNSAFAQAEAPKAPIAMQPAIPPQPPQPRGMDHHSMVFADALAQQEFSTAMQRFNAQMAAIPQAEMHPDHVFDRDQAKRLVGELKQEIAHLRRESLREIRDFDRETRDLDREAREFDREMRDLEHELRDMEVEIREGEMEMRMELQGIFDPEERAELQAEIEKQIREAHEKMLSAEDEMRLHQDAMREAQQHIQEQVQEHLKDREILMEAHSEAIELAMRVMEDVQVQIGDIMSDEDIENLEDRVERAVELAHEKARKAMEDAMQSVEENREKIENKK